MTPSGTSGAVRPNKVYEDIANSMLCTDFQETVNNDQGKAVTQSTTKCRNTDGNWVEACEKTAPEPYPRLGMSETETALEVGADLPRFAGRHFQKK